MGKDNGSYTLAEVAVRYADIEDFDKAVELAKTVGDKQERAVALSKIAVRLWKNSREDEASRLFEEVEEMGIPRSRTFTWGQIATQLAMAQQHEKVFRLVATGTDDFLIGSALEAVVDNFSLESCVAKESGIMPTVVELSKRIKNEERCRVLRKVALRYAEAGLNDDALRVAESMKRNDGSEIDNLDRDDTLGQIAVLLAKRGEYGRAIRLANRTESYFRDGALIEIAGELVANGNTDKALKLLSRVLRSLPEGGELEGIQYEAGMLARIAYQYAKAGRRDKAVELFDRAIHSAESNTDSMEQADSLHKIAGLSAEAGLFEEAIRAAHSINYESHKIKALTDIVIKLIRAGRDVQASELIHVLEGSALEERIDSRAGGLIEVAGEYLARGQNDKARGALLRAFRIARSAKPNDFKPTTLERLAEKYAEAGAYAQALEVVSAIEEPFYRAHALMDIGVFYARSHTALDFSGGKLSG
jgi:tetratricopeptide (TPR) repeat protein